MSRRTPPAAFPRRTFLERGPVVPLAIAAAAPAVAAEDALMLRVGLVGCGGRGTGAALQALGDPAVRIVALADPFADALDEAAGLLAAAAGPRGTVAAAGRHAGADAFRRLLDMPLDAVILAAPPVTRPLHLAAAVAAGRHAWCETPAAVDGVGLDAFAATLERATRERLVVAAGLCARFDAPTVETILRVRDGAIGAVRGITLHHRGPAPWWRSVAPGTPPAVRRALNWVAYRELSGGHLLEHHVHALDRALWILGEDAPTGVEAAHPAEAPLAGFGDVPAGLHVRYTFASGAVVEASCRRAPDAAAGTVETVAGTAGRADLVGGVVEGRDGTWKAAAVDPLLRGGMFAAGMADFLERIRSSGSAEERVAGGPRLLRATGLALAGSVAADPVPGPSPLRFALPRQTPSPSRSV